MGKEKLVETLISQHRALQADLNAALISAKSEKDAPGESISKNLRKFRSDLSEHLKLEGEIFYPDYMRKKMERGEDITSTKLFIEEMAEIGKEVWKFLDRYENPENINADISRFAKNLSEIIEILNMRIETEEDGIYGLYLLM